MCVYLTIQGQELNSELMGFGCALQKASCQNRIQVSCSLCFSKHIIKHVLCLLLHLFFFFFFAALSHPVKQFCAAQMYLQTDKLYGKTSLDWHRHIAQPHSVPPLTCPLGRRNPNPCININSFVRHLVRIITVLLSVADGFYLLNTHIILSKGFPPFPHQYQRFGWLYIFLSVAKS